MKISIFNKTEFQQFVDLVGVNDPKDIITVGPKSKVVVDIISEKQFIQLNKKYKDLIIRKI